MKNIFGATVFLFLLFVYFGSVSAQTEPRSLTWDELKRVQYEERTQMRMSQKEVLDRVIEAHKEQMKVLAASTPNPVDVNILVRTQWEERLELIRIHAEERTKLFAAHAQERAAFLQRRQ